VYQVVTGVPPSVTPDGQPVPLPPGSTISTPFASFAFPLVLDQWLLQAQVVVPISDYFLRINQNYTAATHAQDAARHDLVATKAKSVSDGKVAYYTWMRARGAIVVATQALNDTKTHLKDANNVFAVGRASRADVLRAETAVASAELAVERAKNFAELAEKQVRIATHAKDDEVLVPGEPVDAPPPPVSNNLKQLVAEAHANRYEVKSIDANAEAARKTAAAYRGGGLPQLSAFGDVTYANPNQRRFPQTNEWFPTWSIGAQITWTPNDYVTNKGLGGDFDARAAALEAQKSATRDGIELEVTQAHQQAREADFALETTKRQLASAQEAYRVARELFNAGSGTATLLTDAETELTRARLDALNAAVDARIARVRLDHALGRDTRGLTSP
jgi:outer membrane protein TolC